MISEIIKKIKSCLPKNKKGYHVHEPTFDLDTIKHVKKCISSTFVSTKGEYLDKFSDNLKNYTQANHVLLTNSGTSALFLCLKLLDLKGTEILVPSMTFAATVNSIIYNDAIPHFIDCENNSLNIDVNKFEKYLNENCVIKNNNCINKKTKKYIKCLFVVHAYGIPADITNIHKVCKKYNIEIIEDGAGALGSFINNKHIGIQSRASILSFNGNKIVTTGMGGAILLRTKKDYLYLQHLLSTARVKHPWKVEHNTVGYNMRMSNINASLGYSQLLNIKKYLLNKKELYNSYKDIFLNDKYCYINEINKNIEPNHWVINIFLKDKYKKHQQDLIKELHKHKIFSRELWKPQHLSNQFKDFPKSNLTNSVNNWSKAISLPSSYYK